MNDALREHSARRTVLVTGGCGYLGSDLIRELVTEPQLGNPAVRILDNMQANQYRTLMELPQAGRFEFIEGDILDPAAVRLALRGVDAVVHLAAVARTPLSFEHPNWVEQVNHWGTARLVEACLEAGVHRFVYASSAVVYGPGGPYQETDACRPLGPYAQSKRNAETSVLAAASRGLRPTVLRLGTVFGLAPAMRFAAFANRFAYLAGIGRPLMVFGDGRQVRPLVHVRDASSAICFCLAHEQDTASQVFNVVSENVSVLDLVAAVQAARHDVRVHYTEQDVLTHLSFVVDGHAFEQLGWESRVPIQVGMAEVVSLFKNLQGVPLGASRIEDDT